MLSHQPIQGAHREIGAEALVPIIRPDPSRQPDVDMAQYRAVVRGIVNTLNTIDGEHTWGYVPQGRGKPGKVTCDHKK